MSEPDVHGLPWVLKVGTIATCQHGHTLVRDWSLTSQAGVPSDVLDQLVLAFPDSVVHSPLPNQCPVCHYLATS